MERIKRVQGQKNSKKGNEGGERKPITELASVGLCLSKNCDSFLRALASLSGEPEMQENGSEEGVGEM